MRDSLINQKIAVQDDLRPHYRDHHMPPEKDRDLPFKDALIVLVGVVAAMLLMAVITGWMLEATYEQAEQRTSQVIEQVQESSVVSTRLDS